MLLLDEVISNMLENLIIPHKEVIVIIDWKKPTVVKEDFLPYKADDDLVPPMANFGSGYRYHVTGLVHNEKGYPTSNNKEIDYLIRRLTNKVELNKKDIILEEKYLLDDARVAIVAYGSESS